MSESPHYITELKDDLDKEIANILSRLSALEEKQDQIQEYTQQSNSQIVNLQKSYQGLIRKHGSSGINSDEEDIPLSKKALEDINKSIQDRIDELNERFSQKANLDETMKKINSLKESIININSKKQVDPSSHAAHQKKIEDLQERMQDVEGLEYKIKDLNNKNEELSKQIKSNEEYIDKLLNAVEEKADEKEMASLSAKMNLTSTKLEKMVNHINEVQAQIDSIKKDSGPDFLKLINALEKHLESVQEAFNQRIYETEKESTRLDEELTEFKTMADKTDINLIKLTQKVDSMQTKLDILDQAFGGFMVPSGLLHGNQDNSNVDFLKESLAGLRREYFKFKDEAGSNFALIGETLAKNADKHDLKDLENKINEKVDSNDKSIIKIKSEFRRMIKDIEEKVI